MTGSSYPVEMLCPEFTMIDGQNVTAQVVQMISSGQENTPEEVGAAMNDVVSKALSANIK